MTALRLATWNVLTGKTRERDRVDLGQVASVLRSLDADMVALQEVDRDQPRSGHTDQARELGEALGMEWRYAPALHGDMRDPSTWRAAGAGGGGAAGSASGAGTGAGGGGPAADGPAYGIALLSRVPLGAVETVPLPCAGGRGEPRVALLAEVPVGEGALTLAATHLSFVPRDGARQLRWLQRRLAERPAPRLLAGDLNLWLPLVRLVSLPGWRPLVRGRTFPNHPPGVARPMAQIDHVLTSDPAGAVQVRRTRITAAPVSDHRAVMVEMEVR